MLFDNPHCIVGGPRKHVSCKPSCVSPNHTPTAFSARQVHLPRLFGNAATMEIVWNTKAFIQRCQHVLEFCRRQRRRLVRFASTAGRDISLCPPWWIRFVSLAVESERERSRLGSWTLWGLSMKWCVNDGKYEEKQFVVLTPVSLWMQSDDWICFLWWISA